MKPCELLHMCSINQASTPSAQLTISIELAIFVLFVAYLIFILLKMHKVGLTRIIITFLAVLLFELMIDPAVQNHYFSYYFFHDLTIILTMGWTLIVSLSIELIDKYFNYINQIKRFFLYLCLIDAITLVCEIFLVSNGYRTYAQPVLDSSLGYFIPFTPVPVGVILVIPAVFALVIGFTKYWERVLHV